jgi:Leucine-rich repeat (LRR) protein
MTKYQNPQGWLNHQYADKEKVEKIDLENLDFEQFDELTINDYPNLEEIIGGEARRRRGSKEPKITKIVVEKCPKLEFLDVSFTNSEKLKIKNCPKLKMLQCYDNMLTELDLKESESKDLTRINAFNNNLSSTSLQIFEPFENLQFLYIGNDDKEKIKQGIYNCFEGSLKYLKKLTKLKNLYIDNTDIDRGLEYLPNSLEDFRCPTDKREKCKVKIIEKEFEQFNKDTKKFVEFNRSARVWLDKNYPENGECQRSTESKGWDGTNGWDNKGKKIADIEKLDISGQDLTGGLQLRGFTGLKELNCSNNQLTTLDLGDCSNLVKLKCNNNPLATKNLNFLIPLVNLKELDISGCSEIKGGLKLLESLTKLEKLDISNTGIKEGLEYLPRNIKKIYCELNYSYGSVEIAKELSKFSEKDEESNHTRYNLNRWRIDQANHKTASAIPLERLFVIRGNLKQFFSKWGKSDKIQKLEIELKKLLDEKNQQGDEVGEIRKKIKQEKEGLIEDPKGWEKTELGKLQTPEQYSKYRYFGGIKWVARGTAVAGGILSLTGQPVIGGSLATTSPFIDATASYFEENYYQKREEKWKEFLNDADMFLDNYHELFAITKSIKSSERGRINETFKDLKEKVDNFLKEYDQEDENEEKNEEIDLGELIAKRKNLAQELTKEKDQSKLWEIMNVTKKLENQVTAYRQGENIEEGVEEIKEEEEESLVESQEARSYQQIKEEMEKEEQEKKAKIKKQKDELEREKNKRQQVEKQLVEIKKVLSFLEEKKQLTNEESNLLKLLKEKVEELKKDLLDIKKKIDEIKNRQQQENQTNQVENPTSESWWEKGKKWLWWEKETVSQTDNKGKDIQNNSEQTESQQITIDLDEHFEANQSLNSSSANLLDKSKQKEEIELKNLSNKQIAQILQPANPPYGIPSSSK